MDQETFVQKWVLSRWGLLVFTLLIAGFGFFTFSTTASNTGTTSNTILADIYYVVTVWGIIYTALVASHDYIQATKLKHYQYLEEKKERKLERAMALCSFMDDQHLRKARDYTRELRDSRSSISDDDLIAKIDNDGEIRKSVINMFNYWERVSLSIQNDIADSKYLYLYLSDVFLDQCIRFNPWLKNQAAINKEGNVSILWLKDVWSKKP